MNGTDIYYLGALPPQVTQAQIDAERGNVNHALKFLHLTARRNVNKEGLRYFNSMAELLANMDYDKKKKYFPADFVIRDPWMSWKYYLEICKSASPFEHLKKESYGMEWYLDGRKCAFWYRPQFFIHHIAFFEKTKHSDDFKRSWSQARYYNRFLDQKAISDLNGSLTACRNQLKAAVEKYNRLKSKTPADYQRLVTAVASYNFLVQQIRASGDVEVVVENYSPKIAGIPGDQVALAPIVWVAIIVIAIASSATIIVSVREEKRRRIEQHRANADLVAKNIGTLMQAGEKLQQGQISQQAYNNIVQQVTNDNKAVQQQQQQLTEAPKGLLGEAKDLLLIGGGFLLLTKLVQ